MERSWIGLASLVVLGVLQPSCGTPCENARSRIESRYVECGGEITTPIEQPENEACADGDGDHQKCLADCVDSAECEAFTEEKDEDLQAEADLADCYAACAN